MARYKLWDGREKIYTLVGEELSPEEWYQRYPWARIPGVRMVIGGGVINGTIAQEFSSFLEMFQREGFVRDSSWTDEETLAQMEVWEETRGQQRAEEAENAEPDATERLAAAMEYQQMKDIPDVNVKNTAVQYNARMFEPTSRAFKRIKANYKKGLWTQHHVTEAVNKGFITPVEYQAITGERYNG